MILGIVQARMSSTRLPGKVLRPILGRPMLGRQIDRVKRSKHIDRLIIATSEDASDDAIAQFCTLENISCFRGSLHDVLARFHGAASVFGPADHIVRLTADCPLSDWNIIDLAISTHVREGADLSGNAVERTFPDGLDVEVLTNRALETAHREAKAGYDREHVTPYIYRHPDRFRLYHVVQERNLAELRWTVDTPSDFQMVETVFAGLLPKSPAFVQDDILTFLDHHPEIAATNANTSSANGAVPT